MPARMSAVSATTCVAPGDDRLGVRRAGRRGARCANTRAEPRRSRRDGNRRLERLHPEWKPPADLWTSDRAGPTRLPCGISTRPAISTGCAR
jgi:hypothetical protein